MDAYQVDQVRADALRAEAAARRLLQWAEVFGEDAPALCEACDVLGRIAARARWELRGLLVESSS